MANTSDIAHQESPGGARLNESHKGHPPPQAADYPIYHV